MIESVGEGRDFLDFSDLGNAITIDLNTTGTESVTQTNSLSLTALVGQEIEGIIGTEFGDDIIANQLNNFIDGGAGDDQIRGGDEAGNLPTPSLELGNLGSGVAVDDDATGTGYLLYSATTLEERGFTHHVSNADHFIAVRLVDQQWQYSTCLLYTSPSPRDRQKSRMPSSA